MVKVVVLVLMLTWTKVAALVSQSYTN